MKILILNNYYYPNMEGGAEFSIKLLAENLVKRGHTVYVLSMDSEPNRRILDYECINGVIVYRSYAKAIYRRRIIKDKTHISDKIANGLHSIHNYKMNRDVKKVIKEINPDVIHTQNMVSMSYWVWKYANRRNIPVVHTLRDYWLLDPTTNIGGTPKLFEKVFRGYHRKLSNKYVDVVTSPSKRTLEIFLKNRYFRNSKQQTIVNAISFDNKLLDECLIEKRSRTDIVKFIFAGKVTESKGVKVLIEAFDKSRAKATLEICGTGDLEEWISAHNYSNVYLHGKLCQEDLFSEYRKADVLIVPSLWEEPFGRIVIEGAQFGLPTIGSNMGGIPEIIEQLSYGTVYDSNNVDELALLISEYSDRKILNQLYLAGPDNLDFYSVHKQILEFEEVYKGLCGNI